MTRDALDATLAKLELSMVERLDAKLECFNERLDTSRRLMVWSVSAAAAVTSAIVSVVVSVT